MEQNKEYYTPEMSELYIGYECEVSNYDNPYHKLVIDDTIDYYCSMSDAIYGIQNKDIPEKSLYAKVRTKYLTREDIEGEGWVMDSILTESSTRYEKYSTKLVYNNVTHRLRIAKNVNDTVYDGECKSVNELRKISKMIDI